MQPKSLHPANVCQTIHRRYQNLQHELNIQIDRREEADSRIQRLSDEYFSAADGQDRQRIAREQGAAVADRQQALQLVQRIERELGDVENDYFISGCEDLLGNL
jgi:hypothetical protein